MGAAPSYRLPHYTDGQRTTDGPTTYQSSTHPVDASVVRGPLSGIGEVLDNLFLANGVRIDLAIHEQHAPHVALELISHHLRFRERRPPATRFFRAAWAFHRDGEA